MAINIPIAPAAGRALVEATLPPPAMAPLHLAQAGAEAAPPPNAQPPIRDPYPVFTATIAGLFEGDGLKTARQTAWQYVIAPDGAAQAVAEVAIADFNADPEQALVYASEQPASYADALTAAIKAAEARPEPATRDYELRILRAPELYVLATWLHRENDDLLCLVRGKRAKLDASTWVTEAQLIEALRPLATVRHSATDR